MRAFRRYDLADRGPQPGATASASARTDESGLFVVAGLSAGEHVLRVSAAGWATAVVPGATATPTGEVAQTVPLVKPMPMVGTVRGPDGAGLAGVLVLAFPSLRPSPGRGGMVAAEETTTEVGGGFHFTQLPTRGVPGFMYWGVDLVARLPDQRREIQGEIPAETLSKPQLLTLAGTGKLHGVVRSEGRPVEGATVTCMHFGDLGPLSSRAFAEATTGVDGSYDIAGFPACIVAWVAAGRAGLGQYVEAYRTPSDLITEGQTTRIDISIEPGETLYGIVRTESGAPVAGCTVSLDGGVARIYRTQSTPIDGRFRFEGLSRLPEAKRSPARYWLHVDAPGWAVANPSALIVELPAGRIPVRLDREILLRSEMALRGKVLDPKGRPVSGAIVQVRLAGDTLLDGPFTTWWNWARSGDDGSFVVEGMAPNRYAVEAYYGNTEDVPAASSTVTIRPDGSTDHPVLFRLSR